MPFGTFVLISLFYAFIGVRVLRDLWVRRQEAFDRRLTEADRYLLDQAAFFLLVPISVLLHELGHAAAIWAYGGEVIDFNYYVFAGSVSYREPFTDAQHVVVAAAGTIVNLVLCALALIVVFGKRPPFRGAINEMLFQFAVVSGANAFILYPALDFAFDMSGDWRQMYDGGVPALSAAIFAIHAGILLGAVIAWRSEWFQRRLAVVTEMPAGTKRALFGGLSRAAPGSGPESASRRVGTQAARSVRPAQPAGPEFDPASPAEARLRAALERVASGWRVPVQGTIERRDEWTLVGSAWPKGDGARLASLRHFADGTTQLAVAAVPPGASRPDEAIRRELRTWPSLPDENDLVMALRQAMEYADAMETDLAG